MASNGFDFSDLGGKIVQGAKNLVTTGDTTGNPDATNAKAAAELTSQESDLKTRDQLYQTDPQAYKQQHPLDYATRKAHDFMSDAIAQPVLRNTPTSIRAAAEPKIRAVADAGLAAYGMPTGRSQGVVQQGVVAPQGLDPEEIEAIGGRTIQKAPTPRPVETDGWITEEPSTTPEHPFVYHATDVSRAPSILQNGLRPKSWFANSPEEALRSGAVPVSGNRTDLRVFAVPRSEIEPIDPDVADIGAREVQKGRFVQSAKSHRVYEVDALGRVKPLTASRPDEAPFKKAAKNSGVEYRGIQEGVPGVHPGVAIFQDPQSGTSVALRLDQWSPDKLLSKLRAARESMKKLKK